MSARTWTKWPGAAAIFLVTKKRTALGRVVRDIRKRFRRRFRLVCTGSGSRFPSLLAKTTLMTMTMRPQPSSDPLPRLQLPNLHLLSKRPLPSPSPPPPLAPL